MLQRTLIEAIADLLATDGKSDIEAVAARMKEQFIKYGKGKLAIIDDGVSSAGWMEENPFGIRSDWEQHVVDRGAPMFRLMLKKLDSNVSNQNS
ncbi:hypothetical protein QJS10_CPB21g00329 [Acorus calamus]|uniref:Uncharacterized protein n=1 Tax=Acorus calamus TaxID=4465 RepID=A0AAV9C5L2_ACOCL|nr:hypothetical protein QJS10_CPB21g00329 [Acorus calamus]